MTEQIPEIDHYELLPETRQLVEKSIRSLHGRDRFNEYAVMDQLIKETEKQYSDDQYDQAMTKLHLDHTKDIQQAIWRFFYDYHQGRYISCNKIIV